jgi:hypothetical protein
MLNIEDREGDGGRDLREILERENASGTDIGDS